MLFSIILHTDYGRLISNNPATLFSDSLFQGMHDIFRELYYYENIAPLPMKNKHVDVCFLYMLQGIFNFRASIDTLGRGVPWA